MLQVSTLYRSLTIVDQPDRNNLATSDILPQSFHKHSLTMIIKAYLRAQYSFRSVLCGVIYR